LAREDPDQVARALEALGYPGDALGEANFGVDSDIPVVARYIFLRAVWRDTLLRWRDPAVLSVYPGAQELIRDGADPESLRLLMGSVAFDTAAVLEHLVDSGYDEIGAGEDLPGWKLMEADADEDLTGRRIAGLHEVALAVDPEQREGNEFWKSRDDAPGRDMSGP
jgi:hypothetical protein